MRRIVCLAGCLFMFSVMSAHAGWKDWLSEQLNLSEQKSALDARTITAGLREALEQGTGRAVMELGRENGFWAHPRLRIPMPENLSKIERGLRRFGQDKIADDFVRTLNRAAEQATPIAKDIFVGAIRQMSPQDALGILKGPQDAATQYFRRTTGPALAEAFKPIVTRSTESVGVTAQYKRIIKSAKPLGIVDMNQFDIDEYVTQKALDAMFQLIAEEETRIRTDPVARTTELLRNVFR